jgi:D-alanyl-D-alanine carboxypeptidase
VRPGASVALVVAAGALGTLGGAAAMAALQGAPAPAAPAPARAAPAPPPTVAVRPSPPAGRPADPAVLLAWTPGGLDPGLAAAVAADPAVEATSVVAGGLVDLVASRRADGTPVDGPARGWAIPLDLVAIHPAAHARLVAVPDRAAVAGLGPGQALLGRTSASLRHLGAGGTLTLAGGRTLAVAAVVDDAAIGGAEVAVDRATGAALGAGTDRYVLAAYRGDRAALEARARAALRQDAAVRFRGPGETPFLRSGDAVLPQAQIKARFGEFAYRREPGGAIAQDPAWEAQNIVAVDLPIVGRVRCHRAVVGAVAGALADVQRANLASLVDPAGFGGCWNPRMTRSGGGLSRHAWGVAVDLNTGANPTGFASVQDPRLVEVFRRWGLTSGAAWLVPDAGHFEYVAPPAP